MHGEGENLVSCNKCGVLLVLNTQRVRGLVSRNLVRRNLDQCERMFKTVEENIESSLIASSVCDRPSVLEDFMKL